MKIKISNNTEYARKSIEENEEIELEVPMFFRFDDSNDIHCYLSKTHSFTIMNGKSVQYFQHSDFGDSTTTSSVHDMLMLGCYKKITEVSYEEVMTAIYTIDSNIHDLMILLTIYFKKENQNKNENKEQHI